MDAIIYKIFGWIINLDQVFLLTFFAGMILFFTSFKKISRLLLITSLVIMTLLISPLGMWGLTFLEDRFPRLATIPQDAAGLILLGGNFDLYVSLKRDTIAYNLAAGRMLEFADLAKKYPTKQIVFSGAGHDSSPKVNESTLAKEVFKTLGFDPAKIIFEDKSVDTYENALFTRDMLQPKKDEKWVLVTTALQLPRAVGYFTKMGFEVIPYPVDYHTDGEYHWFPVWDLQLSSLAWKHFIRELAGMTRAYLFHRTDHWIPRPKRH